MKNKLRKHEDILCWIYLLIFLGIGISLALNRSLWLDESLSMRWSALPFFKMMERLINDVHPPFFYIILKAFLIFAPNNLILAKIFIVIGYVLTLLPSVYFLKKQFGKATMFFFTLCLTSLPMMLTKIVEVRMYTWTMCFTIFAAVFAYEVMKNSKSKDWIFFVVFALATAYTHYFGLITMFFFYPMILLYFIIERRWSDVKQWFFYSAVTVVGYLPWLPIALKQLSGVNDNYWIEQYSIMSYLKGLFRIESFPHSTKIYCAIIFLSVVYLFIYAFKKRTVEYFWAFACTVPFIGTFAFGYLYGEFVKPILMDRYLLIPLCLMLFGISLIARDLNKYIVAIVCIFFACMLLLNYPIVYDKEYNTYTEKTLVFFEENIEENSFVLFNRGELNTVIQFYREDVTLYQCEDISEFPREYDEFWFADCLGVVEKNREYLRQYAIEEYPEYGLDDVTFTIYHFTRR